MNGTTVSASAPPCRCAWATSEALIAYHDGEWGVPQHDDQTLFEFLILEGAQAGLSWETVLKKRENYRRAFDGFDPARVAEYPPEKLASLLADPGIIRNRRKIRSAVQNAQAFVRVQTEFGSFDKFLGSFAEDQPSASKVRTAERATRTAASDRLSEALIQRGFNFVGTTICYAFMQAVGVVNDHDERCFRRQEIAGFTAGGES